MDNTSQTNPKYQFGTQAHQDFLQLDATRQIEFFRASLNNDGGFDALDFDGKPLEGAQELHVTTRLIHSYALAKKAGFSGCDDIIDAGMQALRNWHRDARYGGYVWAVNGSEIADDIKLAYGHVFVLLAGASAKQAGHPEADALIADVSEIIDAHYWDENFGLLQDEFARDWSTFSDYRGMNANMHGVEALLAAYETTGETVYLDRAEQILTFFTSEMAPQYGWRIPEHYDASWTVDEAYEGDPMFRPRGSTPGHSFELGRLLLQFWDLKGRPDDDSLERARKLINQAEIDARATAGGLHYTLHLNGKVDKAARYWWPVSEAIGAYASLIKIDDRDADRDMYAKYWEFADQVLIDHERGGWYPEIDARNRPISKQFLGKPDIYHALQADLFPLCAGLSRMQEKILPFAES